jgi:S1-C subfamily serine protease
MKISRSLAVALFAFIVFISTITTTRGDGESPNDVITRADLDAALVNEESTHIHMIDTAMKSVVLLTGYRGINDTLIGSGFFVTPTTVITNAHVVNNVKGVRARTKTGTVCNATPRVVDKKRDLAFLSIDCTSETYLTPTYSAKVGQDVYAIGHPDGLEFTVSKGIISANQFLVGMKFVQFDAYTNFGSSGGPLINSDGNVVGVVSNKSEGDKWTGLGIPIEAAKIDIEASFLFIK